MSERQLPLLRSLTRPPPADAPGGARPAGETGPSAVLRDWHEEREHYDLMSASVGQLYSDPRSLGAPDGLLEQVFEVALGEIKALHLHHRLRQAHPHVRLRKLSVDDLEVGVAAHREGLRLARRLGLAPERVVTLVQPPLSRGEEGKGDTVELRGLDGVRAERRSVVSHVRPPDTRIELPQRWWKTHRPEEAPWNPPPAGWEMSARRWWLKKRLVLPSEGR